MRIISKLSQLTNFLAHRRMVAFWAVTAIALPLPWLVPGCTTDMPRTATPGYEACQVLSIYDGDSMTVSCQGEKVKVRLYCIDAPEMAQEPWGREARDYLRSITGPVVRLEVKDKDRYGRTVAVVWSGDEPVNLRMVRTGQAVVYRKYCGDPQYDKSEQYVRQNQLGLWSKPGTQQQPWAWRRAQ